MCLCIMLNGECRWLRRADGTIQSIYVQYILYTIYNTLRMQQVGNTGRGLVSFYKYRVFMISSI